MPMTLAAGKTLVDGLDNTTIALLVLITGIVVVFLMLIVLTGIIKLYGSIVYGFSQKKTNTPKPPVSGGNVSSAAVMAAPAPAIEAGISGEIVAAIAAAVYCLEGLTISSVKSIRRAKPVSGDSRSAWSMAGRMDNTRPF